ncbi:hypothetical protein HN924_03180 [Candidatus Woesearchaeota archaeon]|jgi:transcription initiation factor TFIIE subunit alpha|nr:hypothetical protein [Candidatus Woesearchaeota archaeon]MBT7062945.1 hypothetical protein [Candidatus Woesearchaeota archaeon]MBT7402573.1 hypothetical protein [Candidatus Woesearchaeota archaeon]
MSESILNILREIGIIIDDDALKVLEILEKKSIVNENDIADALEMRVNDVRKALYKLGNFGFVSYTKEKDIEKKWWYIYNWQLDKAKIHYKYMQHLRAILHRKEQDLLSEEKYAFQCNKCKLKYTYDSALEQGFYCGECNGILKNVTNSRLISQLTKDIKLLLEQVKEEEEIVRKNQATQKKAYEELLAKEEAEEAKVKEKKLADARAKRAATREATKKLAAKNAPKKKVVNKKPAKKKPAKKKAPAKKKVAKKPIKKKAPVKKKVAKKPIKKKIVKKPVKKKPTKKRR